MRRSWLLIFALLLVGTACSKKRETLSDRLVAGKLTIPEIYRSATQHMNERKFIEARKWYRLIEAHAPDSQYFAESKLKIADSYFFDKMATYVEASIEYKSFLTHFPTHPMADYAQYQYGMCFFTEIEYADRDQTSTLTAFTEFKNLIDKYPNSPYSEKAKEKIDLCMLRLAEHEFTVGHYYFRRGRGFELSAESRFKGMIDNYAGQFDELKTYFYLAETLWRREKYKEAMSYYTYLDRNFPKSDFQPFVDDKKLRWERLQETGVDPGAIDDVIPADPMEDNEDF